MKDKYKTKKELIKELQGLRQRISNLEIVETKRKLVEDALCDVSLQREEMERIVNCSPAVVFLWRNAPGWPVEYVSDNVRQFGYSPDDFYSGKLPYSDFIHAGDLERVASEVTHNSSQPGKDKFTQEYRVLTNTGGLRWVDDWTWIRRDENGEITHYHGIILDVTERKRAEEEIRKREERFRVLFEKIPEATVYTDSSIHIKDANLRFKDLFGYSLDEIKGKDLNSLVVPEDKMDEAKRLDGEAVKGGYTSCVTERKRKDGSLFPVSISGGPAIVEGSEIGMITIYKDVTERKRAEEELRQSEERFRTLVEKSVEAIFLINFGGEIVFWNPAAERLIGLSDKPTRKMTLSDVLTPDSLKIARANIAHTVQTGTTQPSPYELTVRKFDGTLALIELFIGLIDYEGEKHLLGTARDVTERKKAEEALGESEEKYRDLIENASDAIFTIDRLGRFINGNKKGEEISGYEREELLGKSFKRLVPVKYMPSIMKIVGKAFRGKIEHGQIEIEIKDKKGRLIPLEITGRTIWGDGKVIAIQCVARDIIERKKAEEIQKLQNRIANAVLTTDDLEQLFKLIHKELGKVMDTSNFFIALYDKENGKISLPYFVDKKDKSGTFPAGKTLTAYIIKNNRPLLMSRGKIDEMIKSGEVRTIGMPSKVWLGVPLQVGQEVIGAIVVQSYEDENALGEEELEILKFVSSQIGLSVERKRGEEALRKSEGEYRDLMEEAPIGLCNIDIKGKVLFVNKRFEEVSGYTREEVVGKNGFKLGMFGEDTINLFAKRIKDRLMGKTPRILEFQFKCKDGRWLWVELDAKLIKKFGVPIGFQLATRDITERRVTREALRESEEKFRAISVSAQHAIIVADNEGNVTYWNKAAENMFGWTSQEILSKELHGFIMPQRFQEAFRHGFDKFKDTGRGDLIGKPFETVGMKRDGTEFPVELSISSVKMGGKWNAIAIMRDLTERRKMEREIEERKTYLEKMLISEPDAVVTHDAEGRVVEWNPGAEKLFGYKRKEVVGKVLDDLIAGPNPEEYREATSLSERFLSGGSIDSFGTIRYRKDGSPVDVIRSGSGIFIKNKLIGVVATYKDITERKKVEEELIKSHEQLRSLSAHLQAVREGERTSIAREIHDDLGQTMTALKMDFSLLNRLIPKEEKVLLRKTESMSKLVDVILRDTKRISTELRPGLLDDLGLIAAIEWQAEEFQNRTQIKCELTLGPEDIVLDRECSTAIFRIFQETLTNIARHANATKASINLTEKGGKLTLKVGDNGRGITEEQIYDSKSFGLIGIRERVAFLGGKVKIKGVPDKGTTITVSIPFGGAGE